MSRAADRIRAWCVFGSSSQWKIPEFLRLIRETGGPEESINAPYATHVKILGDEGARRIRTVDVDRMTDATLAWLDRCDDASLLTVLDSDYPTRFLHAERAPLCLFVRGDRRLLSGTLLMVAGEGNDREAIFNTEEFSKSILGAGYVLSSPHHSTLEKAGIRAIISSPSTPAVVWAPGAPDRVAGAERNVLAKLLQKGGLFVGFRPPGFDDELTDEKSFYLDVAAGSDALLVPAAPRYAVVREVASEMTRWGRDVFAVPGSIHSPLSKGPHLLIRQGAKLVESVLDITEELPVKKIHTEKERL